MTSDLRQWKMEKSQEGIWLVFGDGKYPHDPPRVASPLEIRLWEALMPVHQPRPIYEYRLLLWSFIEKEVEHRLNEDAADGWHYCAQLPTGILLERLKAREMEETRL